MAKWNWAEFNALPQAKMTQDIHCVTTWSKFQHILGRCADRRSTGTRPIWRRRLLYALSLHHQRAISRASSVGKAMVATGGPCASPLAAEHEAAGTAVGAASLLLEVRDGGMRCSSPSAMNSVFWELCATIATATLWRQQRYTND